MAENLVAVIGGTGLGDALRSFIDDADEQHVRTPFGTPSGPILVGSLGGRAVAFLNRHGDDHGLNPSMVPYAANIYALKRLGATAILASGAVGSLRKEIAPRHLVLADQFIDRTWRRRNTFFDGLGAVHCEFDQPCCPRLRRAVVAAAERTRAVTHETGTYVCIEGPQFSTRAESLMHQAWGGDVVGMTALPEARLAREAQMCYALVALVSDYDCWRPHPRGKDSHELLTEIIGNLNHATQNAIELIAAVLQGGATLCDDDCLCRRSLQQAVWTKPEAITKSRKARLSVLFR